MLLKSLIGLGLPIINLGYSIKVKTKTVKLQMLPIDGVAIAIEEPYKALTCFDKELAVGLF